jgi:hypothetical protein
LLDEHISPALVTRLADVGIYAQSVPHAGLAGQPDAAIWSHALDHDLAVVTANARDFIVLLDVEIHPGLIGLRDYGKVVYHWAALTPCVSFLRTLWIWDISPCRCRTSTDPGNATKRATVCVII